MVAKRRNDLTPPWHAVHVIGSLQTGGAEKMVVNFLQAADKTRFRHTVLCLSHAGEMAPEVEAGGVQVKVHRVRFRRFWRDIEALASWFRQENIAVVHSHMYYATVWARVAGLRAGVPVLVTTEHGKELWKNSFHNALGNWLSKRTHKHICVSHDVLDLRTRRQGQLADRSLVIPNGVPIPSDEGVTRIRDRIRGEFGLGLDQPVFGTVGRVVEAKDYPTLMKALAIVRDTIPDIHWLQVGDGPDRPALQEQARALGLADAVTFAGRRTDVTDILRALDLWVMSSVREGLPVSLLEAMAARCPVVATHVGGIPDAVTHGESAWLVPPGDPAAMAAGILEVMGEPELADRLAVAAHARVVRDYSIEAVAGRILEIYEEGLPG